MNSPSLSISISSSCKDFRFEDKVTSAEATAFSISDQAPLNIINRKAIYNTTKNPTNNLNQTPTNNPDYTPDNPLGMILSAITLILTHLIVIALIVIALIVSAIA